MKFLMNAAPTETTSGTSAPAAEAPKEKKPRGLGIGARAKALIREGKSNKEVLETVQKEFPGAKTTMASVNWYRNNLKAKGETVPSAKAASDAAKPAAGTTPPAAAPAKKDDALGDALA